MTSTSNDLAAFVLQSAPWLTAVGAVALGYLNHRRADKTSESDKFQRTIEELHGLYHSLVSDLGQQVERLRDLNVELTSANATLLQTLGELRDEKGVLIKTVKILTRRVSGLEEAVSPDPATAKAAKAVQDALDALDSEDGLGSLDPAKDDE